jgi:predicted SnoaL-like aldol condensation-catalyzing enzyme
MGVSAVLSTAGLTLASFAAAPQDNAGTRDVKTAQRDVEREERNKEIVMKFYDEIFNKHNMAAAELYMVEDYKQHNPNAPDGRKTFVEFIGGALARFPDWTASVKRVAADGDLVFLHTHMKRSKDDRGTAVVDILRVRDGKIVEHWDVVQPVPEKAANQNTMF